MSSALLAMIMCYVFQSAKPAVSEPDLRCGAYCLYAGLKALDVNVEGFDKLEAQLGQPTLLGYSLKALASAAGAIVNFRGWEKSGGVGLIDSVYEDGSCDDFREPRRSV